MTKYRLLVIVIWIAFLIVGYQTYNRMHDPVSLQSTTFNGAQRTLINELVAMKKANLPKEAKITLSDQEWSQIAELDLVHPPSFAFWTDQMTVAEYNSLIAGILLWLVVGVVLGAMTEAVFGVMVGLVVGLVVGVITFVPTGIVSGLSVVLVLGFVVGVLLLAVSSSLWNMPQQRKGKLVTN